MDNIEWRSKEGASGSVFNSLEARSKEGGKRAVDSRCETTQAARPRRTHITLALEEIES